MVELGLRHVKEKHLGRDVWTRCWGDERVYAAKAKWETISHRFRVDQVGHLCQILWLYAVSSVTLL